MVSAPRGRAAARCFAPHSRAGMEPQTGGSGEGAPFRGRRGMSAARRPEGSVVKFPIGRVVREHRIGLSGATPELEAINQAAISMRRAITTLRRQEATLNLLAARAWKKATPEQREQAGAENTRRIYARQDEDRAAAAPPLDAAALRFLRDFVAKCDAEAGDNDDGGSAA